MRPGVVAGFGRRRRCGRRLPEAEWPQVPLVKGLMAATPKTPARGAGRREIGAASTPRHRHSTSARGKDARHPAPRIPSGNWCETPRLRPVGGLGATARLLRNQPRHPGRPTADRDPSSGAVQPQDGSRPAPLRGLSRMTAVVLRGGSPAAQCARATQKSTVSFSACFIGEAGKRASASLAILA